MEKELPIGWIETKLGVIAEWGSGGTPNRSEPNYYNGTIPWVKTGDLNDSIIYQASEYITELGLKKSSAKLFPKGSIIVAMYGATIGKTAKLGFDATTNQACAVAQTSKIVIPEFLHYFLKAEKQEFIEKGKGGAQPNISQTVIKEHPFPLPPLPEQQRIVAKLDTLFGHLDALKTRLDQIPQLLKDFRQKVLTQAVTGKLTEEWREGRKLENSYQSISDSIKERSKIQKVKKSIEDIIELSNDLPDNWVLTTPDFIAVPEKYALGIGPFGSNLMVTDYKEDGVPLVFVRHIKSNDFKGMNPKYVSKEKSHELIPHTVDSLDLLITKMGDPPGDCVIYPKNMPRAVITSDCLKFRVWDKFFDRNFIKHTTNSFYIKEQLGLITKGVAQQKISLERFKTLYYPIPPLEEQQEIVRRVESLFAKADQIEASYQKLKAKIDQLPQALLAKAFRGELVEQLPTDGDARDLLEQIKKLKGEGVGKIKGSGGGKGRGKKLKVEEEVRMVAEDGARYGKR